MLYVEGDMALLTNFFTSSSPICCILHEKIFWKLDIKEDSASCGEQSSFNSCESEVTPLSLIPQGTMC